MSPTVTATAVLDAVAKEFGMDPAALRRRQYDCAPRAVAALLLGRHAGMNQRDVGAWLSMGTGSAVCRQLSRLRDRRAGDPDLAARLDGIESALERGRNSAEGHGISIVKG